MAESNNQSTNDAQGQNSQNIRVRVNERDMQTSYINGFRTNTTSEELIIDVGLNSPVQKPGNNQNNQDGSDQPQVEMVMELTNRLVMNYSTVKRLAVVLGRAVQGYEEQFGEIKLSAADRRVQQGASSDDASSS